ncbi:right-handed parallel beta-helix repeat-containing protein [Streptacidiphilus sp. N1-3]|uniref:Right-handed parallel beta-helix repeat-containing protein n=1 Tax=Streptacidiphilus alkalitolerans TaxID=3342712 RepID=A0ABV6WYW0_9ACTN
MTSHNGNSMRTRLTATALTAGALTALALAALAGPAAVGAAADTPDSTVPVAAAPPLDATTAAKESAVLAAEDRRLSQLRSVVSVAPLHGDAWKSPYRLATASGYTLVLTSRKAAYTVADLLKLAPETFVRQADGSYLLLESIYVDNGAKLNLTAPGGLTLRMASNVNGFVSIVAFGGSLSMVGSVQQPLRITSWDARTAKPDTDPTDGRAYIRAIGGTFTMEHVEASDLGFWSGRTGGISLTGTDRPNTGSTQGPTPYVSVHGKVARKDSKAAQKLQKGKDAAKSTDNLGTSGVDSLPAGAIATPGSQFDVGGLSYVSATISDSTITGDAYGLFVSSANGVQISRTKISGSLVDGLVLYRFATQVVLEKVDSSRNQGDGFVLARAAQEIRISGSTANQNSGNGFTLNGQPLATGPSASGGPVGSYGNNTIANSTANDNGHYGVEVLGGMNINIDNNAIAGNTMGIVVRRDSQKVSLVGNILTAQQREGISIRDGNTGATVSGNIVTGAQTGIYLRDSTAEITGNTVKGAALHAVTLVGKDSGAKVSDNVLSGVGTSAVSSSRSEGSRLVGSNDTIGWHNTTPLLTRMLRLLHPTTLVWIGVFLLIVVAGVKGRRTRRMHTSGSSRDLLAGLPYQDKTPLPQVILGELATPGSESSGRHAAQPAAQVTAEAAARGSDRLEPVG